MIKLYKLTPARYEDDDDEFSQRMHDFDSEDDIVTDRSRSRSGTPRGDRGKGKAPLQRRG